MLNGRKKPVFENPYFEILELGGLVRSIIVAVELKTNEADGSAI
jgi:hypothetical protein